MEPQQVGPSRFPWRGWHSSRAALEGVGQRQLCALLQLSRCRGPVEITVKFNLHISQSWARWLLLERLIPSDKRLWKPKKYPHPPPLSTGLPKILPSCLFTETFFTLCRARLLPFCRLTVTVGFGRWWWLDSTSAQGQP